MKSKEQKKNQPPESQWQSGSNRSSRVVRSLAIWERKEEYDVITENYYVDNVFIGSVLHCGSKARGTITRGYVKNRKESLSLLFDNPNMAKQWIEGLLNSWLSRVVK